MADGMRSSGTEDRNFKPRSRSRSPVAYHSQETDKYGNDKNRGGGFYRERQSSDSRPREQGPGRNSDERRQGQRQWGRNRGSSFHPGRRQNRGPEPQDSFDILAELCDRNKSVIQKNLRLTFDFYTPRAHLVILGRQCGRWRDYTDMDPEIQKELIQIVLDAIDVLALDEATLAIHRGAWVTTKDNFHAHICTDVDKYLKIYGDLCVKAPMTDWWPSRRFVTRQWKASGDPNEYPANVRGYPFSSYKKEEIREILMWKEQNKEKLSIDQENKSETRNSSIGSGEHVDSACGSGSDEFDEPLMKKHCPEKKTGEDEEDVDDKDKTGSENSQEKLLFRNKEIIHHMSKRRIGIIGKVEQNTESLLDFVRLLDDFASSIGAKSHKEGCHVCVDITGKGIDGFPTKDPVLGYLQVSGPVFYRSCPQKQREIWLENYITSEHDKVYT